MPGTEPRPGAYLRSVPSTYTVPVSVVIPCFCAAATLARAVTSVVCQTTRPCEIVIVDDASSDNTVATACALQEEFGGTWIHVVQLPENRGPAAARNQGWNAVRGDYVAFLDADDAWHPRKIELQYRHLREHPEVALCGHRARRVRAAEEEPLTAVSPGVTPVTPLSLLLGNRFVTPSAMLRRELPFRFAEDRRYMEDHLLWLQIACAGHRVDRLDAELAFLYKAPFGDRGLSAALWRMEFAELDNYRRLHRAGRITAPVTLALWAWSLVKFARRLIYTAIPALGERLEPR